MLKNYLFVTHILKKKARVGYDLLFCHCKTIRYFIQLSPVSGFIKMQDQNGERYIPFALTNAKFRKEFKFPKISLGG